MAIDTQLVEVALEDLKKDVSNLNTNTKFIIVEKITEKFIYVTIVNETLNKKFYGKGPISLFWQRLVSHKC